MDYSQTKIEYIKNSIKKCHLEASTSNEILFRDSQHTNAANEIIAISYLNKSIAIMESCKAVYFSCIEELENSTVEHIFERFEIYSNEVLNNFACDHSHQWSNLEFHQFQDAVSLLVDIPLED